jgi:hypothetical protein
MARPWGDLNSEDEAPRPVVRALGWLSLACLFTGTILGVSKRGEPIWKDARVLFAPAGLLLIVEAALLGGRRAHPIVAIPPTRALAPGVFICGLGLVGLGLEQLDPAGQWSILAIPMIALLGLLFLREAWRGKASVLVRDSSDRWQNFLIRAGAWMFGLLWPLFVLWALGLQP